MAYTPIFRVGWIGLALSACEASDRRADPYPDGVEVLVKFQDTMAEGGRIRFEQAHGLTRLRGFADGQTFLYRAAAADSKKLISILQAQPGVVFAERNQTYHTTQPGSTRDRAPLNP